jgi:D-lactate dehydrogenase (cytochrome)
MGCGFGRATSLVNKGKIRILPLPFAQLAPQLAALLGPRFTTSAAERDHHAGHETHHAPRPPEGVAYPLTTEEAAQIVRLCRAEGVAIIPHGAGSSLEGHVAAVKGGLAIDMMRMNRLLRVSAEDMDVTVEAGMTRSALNAELRATGLFFPVDPGADASLGGMCATRASGTAAVRYGTMAENVLALTVVTAEGEVIRTARRARKSAAGYDLTHLYLGSEGTLGLITEVTLRLHPRPDALWAAVVHFPGPEAACQTAIQTIQSGVAPQRMEYLDAGAVAAVNAYSGLTETVADTLFAEFDAEADLDIFAALAAAQGGTGLRLARAEEERNRLWAARHTAYRATLATRPGARGWPTDVCVPLSALAGALCHAKALLRDCPVPHAIMGHLGDGNFHVVFALDPKDAAEAAQVAEINAALVAHALAAEGTSTGEHGVGLGKRKYMAAEHGAALGLMARLKKALDPEGLFNPGKILPETETI